MRTGLVRLIGGVKNNVQIEDHSTIAALQRVGMSMALMMFIFGLLFIGPTPLLIKPQSPPDEWWMSLSLGTVELWDVVFPVSAVILAFCVARLTFVRYAHLFSGCVWCVFGFLWALGGMAHNPSPFFGVGIMAVFVGVIHVVVAQVWFFEGVE